MGNSAEVPTTEPNGESIDSDVDLDENDNDQRAVGPRATLLVDDKEPEPPVTRRHLVALTCGVGG